MAKERERKFLVENNKVPMIVLSNTDMRTITQGYLMLENRQQLRVRIVKGPDRTEGFICYKNCVTDTEKDEFEYKIPLHDAIDLMKQCKTQLIKNRYSYNKGSVHVDIDSYKGIDLVVCELEYKTELNTNDIPIFCTEEVTGRKEYSNIQLAKKIGNR